MTHKLKLPCIVPIAGKDYTLKWDNKVPGAHFNTRTQIVRINPRVTKAELYSFLLHEILEVIYTERLYRYAKEKSALDNGDYMFIMNHDQFEKSINDLGYTLVKLLNL
jgi:hypothetical protein